MLTPVQEEGLRSAQALAQANADAAALSWAVLMAVALWLILGAVCLGTSTWTLKARSNDHAMH